MIVLRRHLKLTRHREAPSSLGPEVQGHGTIAECSRWGFARLSGEIVRPNLNVATGTKGLRGDKSIRGTRQAA